MTTNFKYKWFSHGDIGASATIIFDNITILTFISLILQFVYKFPLDIILRNIIPGTVISIVIGNLLCLWLSFRLAKKEERHATAIPFGLDAPSAIGFILCIVGPVFVTFKQQGMEVNSAGLMAWQVGVGCLFVLGFLKLFCSILAQKLKEIIPQAALLGAIGGVAIALIGFIPLISIFKTPTVGLVALGIIVLTMFARLKLPFNIPSIPAAIIIGTVIYYALIPFNLSGAMPDLSLKMELLLPTAGFDFLKVTPYIINFIPLIIPFALLVVFGTMSVSESARCMGENYKVRDLIVVDSIATIAGALCGGVVQTTPYAGFPAYKKLDARSGFLFLNVIVVGIGGLLGLVGFIVHLVPEAAVAPILLFVAFEIMMQGFHHADRKYIAALLFSFFPSIARLLEIKITSDNLLTTEKVQADAFASVLPTLNDHLVIIMLGNGFIITGILWASMLCFAIDRKMLASFICCVILSIFSYFGVIHSIYANGKVYLPSSLPQVVKSVPLELALGYLLIGIIILLLSINNRKVTNK